MPRTCLKIAYVSRADAVRAAKRAPGGQQPYLCKHCDRYHLSSKSRRTVKQLRKRGTG